MDSRACWNEQVAAAVEVDFDPTKFVTVVRSSFLFPCHCCQISWRCGREMERFAFNDCNAIYEIYRVRGKGRVLFGGRQTCGARVDKTLHCSTVSTLYNEVKSAHSAN
jgi:hypothetical protein